MSSVPLRGCEEATWVPLPRPIEASKQAWGHPSLPKTGPHEQAQEHLLRCSFQSGPGPLMLLHTGIHTQTPAPSHHHPGSGLTLPPQPHQSPNSCPKLPSFLKLEPRATDNADVLNLMHVSLYHSSVLKGGGPYKEAQPRSPLPMLSSLMFQPKGPLTRVSRGH